MKGGATRTMNNMACYRYGYMFEKPRGPQELQLSKSQVHIDKQTVTAPSAAETPETTCKKRIGEDALVEKLVKCSHGMTERKPPEIVIPRLCHDERNPGGKGEASLGARRSLKGVYSETLSYN